MMTTSQDERTSKFHDACMEFDKLMAALQALRDDHFTADPDEVDWGDIGSLQHVNGLLRLAIAQYRTPEDVPC